MVERAQKKLYLDQMVNQDSIAGLTDEEEELGGVSKRELLETLKFGCDAVFGEDQENQNTLPTDQDIELITDRNRSETFSDGRLKGGVTDTASKFKADNEFTSTTKLGGIDFKEIRDKHKKKKTKDAPKDIGGIAYSWMKLQKRNRKSRIVNVKATGSGYGSTSVPVLAANNYDLENGESSVFQRELGGRKGDFGEIKRKVKKSGVDFESQDFCQVCGDGGLILCCPRCPVCVHAQCVGVDDPKKFLSCPHHRCSKCNKNVAAAGGLLFPCQSCHFSFCEDCLPTKEKGFRLLDSCDRFTELGFDSHNYCYIHCSEKCEAYAKQEFEWSEPSKESPPAPAALNVTHAFGSQIDATIEDAATEEICESRLRKRKVMNYKNMDINDNSMAQASRKSSAKKEDDDPEFVAEESDSSDSDEDKAKKKEAVLPVLPTTVPVFPIPEAHCYDVVFPLTPNGYLVEIANKAGAAVFLRYVKTPEGLKGPAEVANRVRGVGDRVVAVNRVDVTSHTYQQILNLLRSTRAAKCHAVVRFREAPRLPPPPKYFAANVEERVALDGSIPPTSTPRKDSNGLYIRPPGRGRLGMSWDKTKGLWVPAAWGFTSRRGNSDPTEAATNKENAFASNGQSSGGYTSGTLFSSDTAAFRQVPPKQASAAVNHDNGDSKPAALKRKSEDVIDLTILDSKRPSKQAPKPKDPPRSTPGALPPLAKGEYQASFPVTEHGLLLEVGLIDSHKVVFGYKRAPDGSRGPAEIEKLIREAGDRIIAVNQTDVTNLQYSDLVTLILSEQKDASSVVLRFQEAQHGRRPPSPSEEHPFENNVPANPTIQTPVPPSDTHEDEYDAAIPTTSRGLMIRVGDLNGSAVFLEYRRFPDGSKGPAEINNLVRNAGDEIVAVNGVRVMSYHHAIGQIHESRNNPVTHLRFLENDSVKIADC